MSNEYSRTVISQSPPGTRIVKTGKVQKGDWFYIESLGAWGLVPPIGWGEPIVGALIARSSDLVPEGYVLIA